MEKEAQRLMVSVDLGNYSTSMQRTNLPENLTEMEKYFDLGDKTIEGEIKDTILQSRNNVKK